MESKIVKLVLRRVVRVNVKQEKQISVRFSNSLKAIAAERIQEEQFFKSLAENRTIQSKVQSGFCWYPVTILRKAWTVGEYLEVTLERTANGLAHKFSEGMAVHVFNLQEEKVEIRGVVAAVRGDKMRVLLSGNYHDKFDLFEKGNTGVELIYDDRPYRVMEEAIRSAVTASRPAHMAMKEALETGKMEALSRKEFQLLQDASSETLMQRAASGVLTRLNESQRQAIQTCLDAPVIGIIHGPPGTGKTTTLVALAKEMLRNEKRLLVCAPSNNAVDLLAERLIEAGIRTIRVGNVTRIHDNLLPNTIEELVRNHTDWAHIKKVRLQAQETERKADQFKRQFGQEEWEERKALRKEARELRKWATELERRLIADIVHGAQVITTTLIGASHPMLEDLHFNCVFIDEASQAREAECWNAILKADRTILAGDHKQLPPTVKSKEAIALGMEITLLDQLADKIPQSALLREQYRMHDDILQFSNQRFYHGLLQSHAGNATSTLRNDIYPLVFIDMAGSGFEEELHAERLSFANSGEFFILREHVLVHRENFLGASIGIISPYAEQVKFIRDQINEDGTFSGMDIEVNTIDGFQGQEKDIIYLSLVRSNERGEIGFLKDERRLNVALTRARKKMILIGDSATLAQHNVYIDLIAHIEKTGLYDSAWNYMS